MTFVEALVNKGKEAGIAFTERQLEQFELYYELLIDKQGNEPYRHHRTRGSGR